MDSLIEKYGHVRGQRVLSVVDFITGGILATYTVIWACSVEGYIWIYLILFFALCVFSKIIKYCLKLYHLYGLHEKLGWSVCCVFKITQLYNKKIEEENIKYVSDNLKSMSNSQINIFYRYLVDTKKAVKTFSFADIVAMGFGFAIGASFDDNALLSGQLLANALLSVLVCFLGLTPFYLIYYKLKYGYIKITSSDVMKDELINYINKIDYNKNP